MAGLAAGRSAARRHAPRCQGRRVLGKGAAPRRRSSLRGTQGHAGRQTDLRWKKDAHPCAGEAAGSAQGGRKRGRQMTAALASKDMAVQLVKIEQLAVELADVAGAEITKSLGGLLAIKYKTSATAEA